jgi:hypothetical protein
MTTFLVLAGAAYVKLFEYIDISRSAGIRTQSCTGVLQDDISSPMTYRYIYNVL